MNKLAKAVIITITTVAVGGYGIAVVSANTGSAQPVPVAPVAVVVTHPVPAELLSDVNVERVNNGLPVLVEDSRLDASAAAKCSDEVTLDYFAHENPVTGDHSWHLFADQGVYSQKIGENLAYGFTTSTAVVNGWMNSPGHKANILNPAYTHVGYAVCQPLRYSDSVVQHFAAL